MRSTTKRTMYTEEERKQCLLVAEAVKKLHMQLAEFQRQAQRRLKALQDSCLHCEVNFDDEGPVCAFCGAHLESVD